MDEWPAPVWEHLRQQHGAPGAVERLGGMSLARVYRVRCERDTVIVKVSPRAGEAQFYERIAPDLRRAGVPIPNVELVLELDGTYWLVMEELPELVPALDPARWQPEPGMIAVLARLHHATRNRTFELPGTRSARWTDAMTRAMLGAFPDATAREMAGALATMQRQAERLNKPWCWISGDPSPPNWGRRADGSLALFDWELFRPGIPATDLAITVPGLPAIDAFRQVAVGYRTLWDGRLPWSVDELVRDMAIAKVGTVVALMAAQASGAARVPDAYIARLVADVPPWIGELQRAIR